MGLTVAAVLKDVALGLQAQADTAQSASAKAAWSASAIVVNTVAQLVDGKSDAEAVAILEHIRDHGTTPISAADKAGQAGAAVDKAFGG